MSDSEANTTVNSVFDAKIAKLSQQLYEEMHKKLCVDSDKVFSILLALQWGLAIVLALVVSPRTWIGERDLVHIHVIAAVVIGGILSILPIYLNRTFKGAPLNRYVNVIAQGFYSVLLIHLTGGRIETHFHVFGSLAFFAFYRDIRVLLVGTAVVAVDHAVRGIFLPESVFGVFTESNWRWLEHASWVLFENFFLSWSILRSISEMKTVSWSRAVAMVEHEKAQELVRLRTAELQDERLELKKRNERLETIYHNVRSGFLLVNRDLAIEEGYTESCVRLLGPNIKQKLPLQDVLGLKGRHNEHFQFTVDQVFDDVLPEHVALASVPAKFTQGERVIRLEGGAVRNTIGSVTHILFTLTDITDLQRTEEHNNLNLSIIRILHQRDAFYQFVMDAKKNFEESLSRNLETEQFQARFLLHSIKGSASVFGLDFLVEFIHQIEDMARVGPESLRAVEKLLKDFLDSHGEILNIKYDDKWIETYVVDDGQLSTLANSVSPGNLSQDPAHQIGLWIDGIKLKPSKSFLSPVIRMGIIFSNRLAKDVDIVLEKPDFLIDGALLRPVLQSLNHLVRNSIDHGIERPDHRGSKSPRGQVRISTDLRDGFWLIEVMDDGAGIEVEKVCAAALRNGLINKEQLEAMTYDEKIELIFLEGVSTCEAVSHYSGRGMGMPLLANAVKNLSGSITVSSAKGKGTVIRIAIPVKSGDRSRKPQLPLTG